MKKNSWMSEELLTRLLFSLRWYANRYGDRDGMRFDTIKGTGFSSTGALHAVSVRDRDAWKDLRPALEALVALGLVEKINIALSRVGWSNHSGRRKLYRWRLTPAGFAANGVGSATMTVEQLASLDQAIEFHKDDQKRRAERMRERQAERETCAGAA